MPKSKEFVVQAVTSEGLLTHNRIVKTRKSRRMEERVALATLSEISGFVRSQAVGARGFAVYETSGDGTASLITEHDEVTKIFEEALK